MNSLRRADVAALATLRTVGLWRAVIAGGAEGLVLVGVAAGFVLLDLVSLTGTVGYWWAAAAGLGTAVVVIVLTNVALARRDLHLHYVIADDRRAFISWHQDDTAKVLEVFGHAGRGKGDARRLRAAIAPQLRELVEGGYTLRATAANPRLAQLYMTELPLHEAPRVGVMRIARWMVPLSS